MQDKKVLITGGLGFIGSNLAHELVRRGAKVTIYDACLEPYGWNIANIREIKDKVELVKADIRDEKLVSEHVRGKDCIFHCAAQVSHIDSIKEPFLDIDINVKGTMTLLEAVRKHAESAKIIYAGTRGQMGSLKYSPADEEHPDNPADIYGIDKLAAEKCIILYNNIHGIHATSIRINNTYGPRHQMKHSKYGILNWFIRLALEGKKISVYAPGTQLRDYNYIDDVVEAMILASQSPRADGHRFLLGSGRPVKLIDLVKMIIRTAGSGSYALVPWPKERKQIEVGDFFVTYEKIKKTLGWTPKVSLGEGLKRTIDFYRERLGDYI